MIFWYPRGPWGSQGSLGIPGGPQGSLGSPGGAQGSPGIPRLMVLVGLWPRGVQKIYPDHICSCGLVLESYFSDGFNDISCYFGHLAILADPGHPGISRDPRGSPGIPQDLQGSQGIPGIPGDPQGSLGNPGIPRDTKKS